MRALARLVVILVVFGHVPAALAHASLLAAAPSDGAVLGEPPQMLGLVFNEPVSPLVMRLIGPSGEVIVPAVKSDNESVVLTPPRPLRQGSYVVSWRVISADGHPVGGAYVFSVGAPSGEPVAGISSPGDAAVRACLWAARVLISIGLFIGVGGVFFRTWITDPPAGPGATWPAAALAGGLFATIASVGLQGLDALDLPFSAIERLDVWRTGLATSYGLTAIAAACALVLGLITVLLHAPRRARALSLLGLVGVGLALSLSGHAATAPPRALTIPAVFLHGVCVAFWVGSFVPLIAAVRSGEGGALARFTRAIPYALAILVVSGATLALVQLDRIDALWTTDYGVVLLRKLVFVAMLLALGAANRYWLVPRFNAAGSRASRPLALSFAVETVLALIILSLVALWRFTPPPRAVTLAEAEVSVHFHGTRAMAQIDFEPVRTRGANLKVQVFDGKEKPLAVKEVTVVLSKPAASVEPLRRVLASDGGNLWRSDGLRLPIGGVWRLRVEILIDDFERAVLEDNVSLPPLP